MGLKLFLATERHHSRRLRGDDMMLLQGNHVPGGALQTSKVSRTARRNIQDENALHIELPDGLWGRNCDSQDRPHYSAKFQDLLY